MCENLLKFSIEKMLFDQVEINDVLNSKSFLNLKK